jgi:hypothetical protein
LTGFQVYALENMHVKNWETFSHSLARIKISHQTAISSLSTSKYLLPHAAAPPAGFVQQLQALPQGLPQDQDKMRELLLSLALLQKTVFSAVQPDLSVCSSCTRTGSVGRDSIQDFIVGAQTTSAVRK